MVYPPSSYRHTLDQEAFEALNHFPRFVGLCEAYIANEMCIRDRGKGFQALGDGDSQQKYS